MLNLKKIKSTAKHKKGIIIFIFKFLYSLFVSVDKIFNIVILGIFALILNSLPNVNGDYIARLKDILNSNMNVKTCIIFAITMCSINAIIAYGKDSCKEKYSHLEKTSYTVKILDSEGQFKINDNKKLLVLNMDLKNKAKKEFKGIAILCYILYFLVKLIINFLFSVVISPEVKDVFNLYVAEHYNIDSIVNTTGLKIIVIFILSTIIIELFTLIFDKFIDKLSKGEEIDIDAEMSADDINKLQKQINEIKVNSSKKY